MNAEALRVGGITPLTTIDYPGELAAVVFLQGCPWRCHYCHNPELLPARRQGAIAWERIHRFLERRQGLLDAVVFSGGEPTAQAALASGLNAVRRLGFRVGLHTAGIYPGRLARLLPLVDWVGLDIKALPDRYAAVTGVPGSGEAAWRSAALVAKSQVPHEVRITRYRPVIDAEHLGAIIQRLRALGVGTIRVQTCNPPPEGAQRQA
ncbi:MAG: anaerobic ribonucleoside-triphosphate reductase activating protein [Ectothiorhodospiraceae bacterium]|nr:anaerobic ribonucleoside-triphosphate reductase activating protein [Ectothiorhodospiraceae bacterium]